jgi:hypothetical protein
MRFGTVGTRTRLRLADLCDRVLLGFRRSLRFLRPVGLLLLAGGSAQGAEPVDLTHAVIVVRPGAVPTAEQTAGQVLREELQKRTGLTVDLTTTWPTRGVAIALSSTRTVPEWAAILPKPSGPAGSLAGQSPEFKPEGYRVTVTRARDRTIVWILGADPRGSLFGVGELLRALRWSAGHAAVPGDLDVATAPQYAIRGHQLGYRAQANSYDGWDARQFDQYIRELALFGDNSIEGIPHQDNRASAVFTLPRAVMNRKISEACARYDLDYWLWMPAEFDLREAPRRARELERVDALFRDLPRLDAIFFPGGDPGNNPPSLVIPYLQDMAARLAKPHPRAKIWLSLQWFDANGIDEVYGWIDREQPSWLGGLVAGPSSPPLDRTRARLLRRYGLRDYPDITHTVRSQYTVPWWDPAFNFTLGREPINPRPVFYAAVHARTAPYTNGFISYSDGVNDDLNKAIWTRLAWQPGSDVRGIVQEYTRFFFGERIADRAADGLLALEKNWEGPLATNGSVDGTLALWQALEREEPALARDWRWQMYLLRAYYDAYTRHRLIYETALEHEANRAVQAASQGSVAAAIDSAQAALHRAITEDCCTTWRERIHDLCEALFQSIRLQTSVPKYHASGAERGAVLDFVDYPLNNRWWLEDEFVKVRALSNEAARLARLEQLRTWEDPGPGSFYDDIGNVARSAHVVRAEATSGFPFVRAGPQPHFVWEQEGKSRARLSWQSSLRWPLAIVYDQIESSRSYVLRLNGNGDVRPRIDGQPVAPAVYSRILGEPTEYRVPADALKDGRVVITFDPVDERQLNWRQQSRLVEAWLIANPQ